MAYRPDVKMDKSFLNANRPSCVLTSAFFSLQLIKPARNWRLNSFHEGKNKYSLLQSNELNGKRMKSTLLFSAFGRQIVNNRLDYVLNMSRCARSTASIMAESIDKEKLICLTFRRRFAQGPEGRTTIFRSFAFVFPLQPRFGVHSISKQEKK